MNQSRGPRAWEENTIKELSFPEKVGKLREYRALKKIEDFKKHVHNLHCRLTAS